MNDVASEHAAGCLLCLVQASESMRLDTFQGPFRSKMSAALRVTEELIGELIRLEETAEAPPAFEVGVVVYRTGRDGQPRLRPVLPGSSRHSPMVPLYTLDRSTFSADWADRAAPSGAAPARVAFYFARKLLGQWWAEHPRALHPLVIHITDGESSDGPIDDDARALRATGSGVRLIHCLFRQGLPPRPLHPYPRPPAATSGP